MKSDQNPSLEQILESAIIVSWADLMRDDPTGLIHIEYNLAPDGTLDCLKVWLSISRGHWLLVCEYWMSVSKFHGAGIRFNNGYRSEGLPHILEAVMQHQHAFTLPPDLGRQGLLQISTPTKEEREAAAAAVHRLDALFDQVVAT